MQEGGFEARGGVAVEVEDCWGGGGGVAVDCVGEGLAGGEGEGVAGGGFGGAGGGGTGR